jgi:hypothetical protein
MNLFILYFDMTPESRNSGANGLPNMPSPSNEDTEVHSQPTAC